MRFEFSTKFIYSYRNIISNDLLSEKASEKLQLYVLEKIENIMMFPRMYPILYDSLKIRKIVVSKYIILYYIDNNIIFIDDILHQKSKKFNNQEKD